MRVRKARQGMVMQYHNMHNPITNEQLQKEQQHNTTHQKQQHLLPMCTLDGIQTHDTISTATEVVLLARLNYIYKSRKTSKSMQFYRRVGVCVRKTHKGMGGTPPSL